MHNEFVSNEERDYPVRFGKVLASALAGFVAGAVFASIVWITALYFANQYGSL